MSRHCLHESGHRCRDLPELNSYEEVGTSKFPQGDVMNYLRRGTIQKDWNAGLRNPQAKKLTIDTYNGGCVDMWGCVPTGVDQLAPSVPGFSCHNTRLSSMGPEMKEAYAYLNRPLLRDGYEYNPPEYMMGIKNTGPNSVMGRVKHPSGSFAFEHKIGVAANADGAQEVPGCG